MSDTAIWRILRATGDGRRVLLVPGAWCLVPGPTSLAAVLVPKPLAFLGVPFDGAPGPLNAMTDVKGVEVGHSTIISGEGKLVVGGSVYVLKKILKNDNEE